MDREQMWQNLKKEIDDKLENLNSIKESKSEKFGFSDFERGQHAAWSAMKIVVELQEQKQKKLTDIVGVSSGISIKKETIKHDGETHNHETITGREGNAPLLRIMNAAQINDRRSAIIVENHAGQRGKV